MKPTDSQTEGFDWQASSSEAGLVTRRERLREFYEIYVYEPTLVAWSDIRTRIGLIIVAFYILIALVALLGLWRQPTSNQAAPLLGMWENMAYPLGTDRSGTDLAALLIHSTPNVLVMIVAGAVWATGVAVLVGGISGYKGGRVDDVMMSISDFMMAIPGLPLVIVLAISLNPENPIFIGMIITINYWAGLGRTIRSQVLSIREESYVEASRTMGVSTPKILYADVLPNVMPYVTVNFVFAARYTIFAAVGLYFIGVLPWKVQNWGVTLQFAYNQGGLFSLETVHWLIAPMIAIMGIAFGITMLAQGMDRIFNPRVRTRLKGESTATSEEIEDEVTTQML